MRLLLKAALLNKKHYFLLIFTLVAMVLLTMSSQMEIFSLGVITKSGPDLFALFGSKEAESISLEEVQTKWPEIANPLDGTISRSDVHRYLSHHSSSNLLQKIIAFLNAHFQVTTKLSRLAFLLVFVALFKAASLFVYRYFTQLVAIRVSRDLRQKYFEHIQSLPMSFYQEHNIGTLSTRVVGDATVIASATNAMLVNYIQAPFAFISTMVACFYLSWKLSLIIFIGFPLILFPVIFIAKRIKILSKQLQRNQEGFASVLIDFLAGIMTVKVFAMEEFSLKKYREQNNKMAKLEEKSARYGLASRPILHSISSLFFAAVILSGIYLFHMGASELLVFCGLLYIFYEPIKKFAEENNQILRGVAAVERMYEVLDLQSSIVDEPNAKDLASFNEAIEFKNVCFRYKDEWVLKNLSFSVKKGKTVAIVGPTGSGKSTIVQLLPRLYDVQEGEILIDGKSIKTYRQKSLREKIAFVPQKPFLFLDTVKENISFGKQIPEEKIMEAARQAHAEEFIINLPGSYDSKLDEGGKNLSGGQQQRLAIARALAKEAPILIMDEATSSLDALSERTIQQAILGLQGKITQIIIAHRFSTIEHADMIIYLEKGEKVAEGTKDELLAMCPNFRRMWEIMHDSS